MVDLEALRPLSPCYLYDQTTIVAACQTLRQELPGFEFLYSIKANPFPPVVTTVAAQGLGADAASVAEVDLARKAGIAAENIFYSAPGKTENKYVTSSITVRSTLQTPEAFSQLPLRSQDGKVVRLRDVANVELAAESTDTRVNFNGKPGTWGHAIGGMGAISDAIAAECSARGVVIETGAETR